MRELRALLDQLFKKNRNVLANEILKSNLLLFLTDLKFCLAEADTVTVFLSSLAAEVQILLFVANSLCRYLQQHKYWRFGLKTCIYQSVVLLYLNFQASVQFGYLKYSS